MSANLDKSRVYERSRQCRAKRIERDLSDAEWTELKPLLPAEKRIGSPREVELREVVTIKWAGHPPTTCHMNVLMYVADNGIKWRAMPHDLPAWQTVYGYFRRWSQSGVWEQVNQALGKQVCLAVEREEQPSLGLMDSQSVDIAQKGDLNKVLMATRRSKDASGT